MSTIDRVSVSYRPILGELSARYDWYRWTKSRHTYRPIYRTTVDWVPLDSRPTVSRLSTDCRSIYAQTDYLNDYWTNCETATLYITEKSEKFCSYLWLSGILDWLSSFEMKSDIVTNIIKRTHHPKLIFSRRLWKYKHTCWWRCIRRIHFLKHFSTLYTFESVRIACIILRDTNVLYLLFNVSLIVPAEVSARDETRRKKKTKSCNTIACSLVSVKKR